MSKKKDILSQSITGIKPAVAKKNKISIHDALNHEVNKTYKNNLTPEKKIFKQTEKK